MVQASNIQECLGSSGTMRSALLPILHAIPLSPNYIFSRFNKHCVVVVGPLCLYSLFLLLLLSLQGLNTYNVVLGIEKRKKIGSARFYAFFKRPGKFPPFFIHQTNSKV